MHATTYKMGVSATPRMQRGHTTPRPPTLNIDEPGWLRVGNLLHLLQISHSTLYSGIKSGRYPPPDGRDGRRPYWLTSTVRPLVKAGHLCTRVHADHISPHPNGV